MKISVVVPVMNEEDNVKPLFDNIKEALKGYDFEAVIVDDGSTDTTVQRMKEEADARFRIVVLKKNYGQSTAMAAGISEAQGDFIATMDGDLQNDPSDIAQMLAYAIDNEYDVVTGIRQKRKDSLVKKIPSKISNISISE